MSRTSFVRLLADGVRKHLQALCQQLCLWKYHKSRCVLLHRTGWADASRPCISTGEDMPADRFSWTMLPVRLRRKPCGGSVIGGNSVALDSLQLWLPWKSPTLASKAASLFSSPVETQAPPGASAPSEPGHPLSCRLPSASHCVAPDQQGPGCSSFKNIDGHLKR